MLALLSVINFAQAGPIAQVVAVDGEVSLVRYGEEIAIEQKMEVDESDTVKLTDDSQLYLVLANNRVVVFEDELELPGAKIRGGDGPEVQTPVHEQLTQLIDPDDQDRMRSMITATEAIGGWEGRLRSASVITRGNDDELVHPGEEMLKVRSNAAPPARPTLAQALVPLQSEAHQKCMKKWIKKSKIKGDTVEIMAKADKKGRIESAYTSDGDALSPCMLEPLLGVAVDPQVIDGDDNVEPAELPLK